MHASIDGRRRLLIGIACLFDRDVVTHALLIACSRGCHLCQCQTSLQKSGDARSTETGAQCYLSSVENFDERIWFVYVEHGEHGE